MSRRSAIAGLAGAMLFVAGCSDSVGPERRAPGAPLFDAAAGGAIAPDRQVSTLASVPAPGVTILRKGFNPVNPHNGSALVVTFFWVGSASIQSVNDQLTNGRPVGNHYEPVELVTAGGLKMATYVATNIQNFPDAFDERNTPGDSILVVVATLSSSVTRGGVLASTWTGVAPELTQALGAAHSDFGSTSSSFQTTIAPGPITVGTGSLVYGIVMSDAVVGHAPPGAPFVNIPLSTQATSDGTLKTDGAYAVLAGGGTADPQWLWDFTPSTQTWLATVLELKPGDAGPPAPPTTGDLTVTTSTTGASLDPDGYTVTVEAVTSADPSDHVATNGTVTFFGLEAGDYTVTLSDVASNCTVVGDNPQGVTVPAGDAAATFFEVVCLPKATRLLFTQQPGNALPYPLGTIPTVRVTAVDDQGNRATSFGGQVTIAIGNNAGLLAPGVLRGTKTVTAVNGVATFSNLSIDQPGVGYTLRATSCCLTGAESARFTILTPLPFP
jgi:hypothetical protein